MKRGSVVAVAAVLITFLWVWPEVNTQRKYGVPETESWHLSDPETNAATRWVTVGKTYKISTFFATSRVAELATRTPVESVRIDNVLGEVTFHQPGVSAICSSSNSREHCKVFIATRQTESAEE